MVSRAKARAKEKLDFAMDLMRDTYKVLKVASPEYWPHGDTTLFVSACLHSGKSKEVSCVIGRRGGGVRCGE